MFILWLVRVPTLHHVSSYFNFRFGPYFVEPIVAGLDTDDTPYVATMDLIGCPMVTKDFVVGGTCSEQLYGMCESLYQENMEPDDLFECISQALLNSQDRDALSGWGGIVYIMWVTCCLVYGFNPTIVVAIQLLSLYAAIIVVSFEQCCCDKHLIFGVASVLCCYYLQWEGQNYNETLESPHGLMRNRFWKSGFQSTVCQLLVHPAHWCTSCWLSTCGLFFCVHTRLLVPCLRIMYHWNFALSHYPDTPITNVEATAFHIGKKRFYWCRDVYIGYSLAKINLNAKELLKSRCTHALGSFEWQACKNTT